MVLLAGCAADPGMRGQQDAARYQADLTACQDSTEAAASQRVKRRVESFVLYYITFPRQWRHDVEDCLAGRGYDRPG